MNWIVVGGVALMAFGVLYAPGFSLNQTKDRILILSGACFLVTGAIIAAMALLTN